MKKIYKVEVDCANCAAKMEDAIKETNGVKNAVMNFMAQKLTVEFDDNTDISAVMQEVYKNCKKIEDDCVIYM